MVDSYDQSMPEDRVRRLVDEQEIRHLLLTYARGVDRRDWDLMRSAFHPDAHDRHGPYEGDIEGLIVFLDAALADVESTMHLVGNILIEFADEDTARVETYALAMHREFRKDGTPVDLRFGVRYVDRVERRDRWAIADRLVVIEWSRADDVVRGEGIAEQFVRGSRDRSDPSYD